MSVDKINITETIAKVKQILRKDKSASPQFRALMELLVVIVELLANKLNLNSRNSSKPPSSDPHRKRGSTKKTRGKKRKAGGQKGHNGTNLKRVENPDKTETLDIDRRTLPSGEYEHIGYEKRQVIDIEISRRVTEYCAEILEDSGGNQFVAEFPQGVTRPVQYGNAVKAHAVYMSQHQLVPYDRIAEYFSDQCTIPLSSGSLFNFNKEAYELLSDFEVIARQRLINAELLHADETGINVNGKLRWLHSASNEKWTLFFPHERRGIEAMKAMGILEHFRGILCHDHWKAYFQFECLHALCNAHYVRELERAWEQEGQKWAKRVQELLLEINDAVNSAGGRLTKKAAKKFIKRYRTLLTKADRECPAPEKKSKPKRGRTKRTKARNLLERLGYFETEVLRFMTDKRVPFTNNQAEQDIRMTKVQQKISGCFRSWEGAKIFCRVRGYLSSCRKHGVQPTEALQILFAGKLPKFAHSP